MIDKAIGQDKDEAPKIDYTYEENYAMENFYQNIKVTPEGRYCIFSVLKENAEPLGNNYFLALMRYRSLKSSRSHNHDRKN